MPEYKPAICTKTFLRICEAADVIGVTKDTVRRHLASGKLKGTQDRVRRWWIDPKEIDAFLKGESDE